MMSSPLHALRAFLDRQLTPDIRRLVLAYSGGLDSAALLHALVTLRAEHMRPILLVHVHHGLSPSADLWAAQAAARARHYDIPCRIEHVVVDRNASLEQSARRARYGALNAVLAEEDALLLGHHRDDQAETVLLRLMRGSGVRGLGAMHPVSPVPERWGELPSVPCWRPWLDVERTVIAAYAQEQALVWVDDESNADHAYDRNYLRHAVLPALRQRWPQATAQLVATSARMREADDLLAQLAELDFRQACDMENTLNISQLADLSPARRHNLLRFWLGRLGLPLPDHRELARIWTEVCLARPDAEPVLAWPGAEIRRYRQRLFALVPWSATGTEDEVYWPDRTQPLRLPGGELLSPADAGRGISAELWRTGEVCIRFRRGGERIRPVGRDHHHALKKLLQAEGVPGWRRQRIPLVYINNRLAAVVGYWVADECAG